MRSVFLLLFSFFYFSLQSQIIEINRIEAIKQYIDHGTLILFDIDNTIVEPTQTLGSDQWFYHRIECYKKKGYPKQEALENALAEWMAVQNLTHVQIVEKGTKELIDELQENQYILMGLTTRGLGMALRTIEQLKSLQIDLSKTAPFQEEIFLLSERGTLFREGILFTAGTDKGHAFLQLFKHNLPKRVVFINDKESHLREVEKACDLFQIPFLGLRYGFLDEKVARFSSDIAAIQWEHFGKILTDDQAETLLSH